MSCGCSAGAQGAPGGPAENPVYPLHRGAMAYNGAHAQSISTPGWLMIGAIGAVAAYLVLTS